MEKNYAIVENGIVTNIVVWDGVTDFEFSELAIESTDENQACIGLSCADGIFEQPTEE
jgi:hypothetical protein